MGRKKSLTVVIKLDGHGKLRAPLVLAAITCAKWLLTLAALALSILKLLVALRL